MMTDVTLTDFLLARIADTIAEARWVQAQGVTDGLDLDDPRSVELRLARYVLADCEAKRRIVELFLTTLREFNEPYPTPEDIHEERLYPEFGGGVLVGLRDAVKLLALPYADHPDYRDEWRP